MGCKNFIWAHLIQLGTNMWNEEGNTRGREGLSTPCASPILDFKRELWDAHVAGLKESGVNTLVVDVGEAMRYESHPELAVEGSFDHATMRAEVDRLRALGFEVVPKLNFSTCHDVWLKEYSRMVSTPTYYRVCKDLIDEVCAVFRPKYFHLGMDEESAGAQRFQNLAIMRQYDLWWHDLYYLVDCVERNNVRAWIWSDYVWKHTEEFVAKMPKSVLQSNWYYDRFDDLDEKHAHRLECFDILDAHGYDQVPTGSIFAHTDNLLWLAEYCKTHLGSTHFCGLMQTAWERIDAPWMHRHRLAEETIAATKAWFEKK